jgi:glucose-6-phosphate dehydrogenase assembly protein OpcA
MTRATIHPEKLLKDLAELWVSLGEEKEGVLRACTMTMIVMAEESDQPEPVRETLAALMREHPSRAILVRFRPAGERELSARVYAQCWMPFGRRQQICCEQIEIAASDASMPDLASVLLALVAPDLPAVVWCRSPRLFRHRDFPPIAAVAQKVIVDAARFGPAKQAFAALLAAPHGRVADLAWTRLTRWRQMTAQVFENRDYLNRIPAVRGIRISYAGDGPPIEGYYLGAWMRRSMQKAGATEVGVIFQSVAEETPGLSRIEMECPGLSMSLGLSAGTPAETRLDDLTIKARCPEESEHALLAEELRVLGRDPLYEAVLVEAAELAAA